MNRLAKLLEDVARLQNQIKSAMAYPVTVGIFAVIAFFGYDHFLDSCICWYFRPIGCRIAGFDSIYGYS